MALITFEGFDAFMGGGLIRDDLINSGQYFGWTANPGPIAGGSKVPGLLGGSAWRSDSDSNSQILFIFPNSLVTFIIGHRMQIPTPSDNHTALTLFDSAGGAQIGLGLNASQKLFIFRGTTANIIGTGTITILSGGWYYVEFKATINSSTGSIQVKVDGVTDINVSGINTQATANANVARITWQWVGAQNLFIDDFYLSDDTGPAPFNSFLCDPTNSLRVETLFPLANSSVAFTPITSTNVSQIKEVDSDNDSTYNFTQFPNIDIFTHGALSSTPQQIFAVNVMGKLRSDDVSFMTFRNKLVSGATTSNGATYLAGTVYQYIKDQYINDPNTATTWTATAINNALIGYERIT